MHRRAFVLGTLALAACKGRALPSDPSDGGIAAPPPVSGSKRARSPIGYSQVNRMDGTQARRIVDSGLTLAQYDSGPSGWNLARLRDAANVMRTVGGTLFVTASNWNGTDDRAEPESVFRDRINGLIQTVGPGNVWLVGVSEPDGSVASLRNQRIAREMWPGTLVANGLGGRGSDPVGGATVLDWHYCSVEDLLANVSRGDRLHSSDCSPALASNWSELEVREATKRALRFASKLILYDTHAVPVNTEVLRWMADEVRQS